MKSMITPVRSRSQVPVTYEQLVRGDEAGVRLEYVAGKAVWEAWPAKRHQKTVDRIRASIRPNESGTADGCGCIHYADIYVRFPDGTLERPDISIFCREPEEDDEAVTLVPEAVVEILSQGYEAKDLEIGVPFYQSQGIRDIIVVNPYDGTVSHTRPDGERSLIAPVAIDLACGCALEVPAPTRTSGIG